MTEYKLFTGDVPHVSTAGFHEHRDRAPHLEQAVHQPRLHHAKDLVATAAATLRADGDLKVTVSDLGCGDGGLLQLLATLTPAVTAWGFDFQPSNQAGWAERGVTAHLTDIFAPHLDLRHMVGDIAVTTEVLEHLARPHDVVARIRAAGARYLVASSPWNEHPGSHDACHAWAWDTAGYAALLEQAGWVIERHDTVDQFQVVLARAEGANT